MHVLREDKMQAAIDRVMQAFTLMANLTPEEAQATRERLAEYLAGREADEKALAVEGLRYLRGPGRVARRRMARESA
jgi:acyl-CoA reductase-like NAD-dependent aldehyde dehydrogenase